MDFSVIIPTRNRCQFLKKAIDTILKQRNVSVEIIVIDDNSDDETETEIAHMIDEGYRIIFYKNKECCFAHESRRRGLRYVKGKYIIFMDDDDYYTDFFCFLKIKNIFEKYPQINSVIGSTRALEKGKLGDSIDLGADGYIENREYLNGFSIKYKKPDSTLSAAFRREQLDLIRLSESPMVNDTCIYLYGILNGDVYLINKAIAVYRIHSNNISNKTFSFSFIKSCLDEKIKIYKEACKQNLLDNKTKWLYIHLSHSICYFLHTSKNDIKLYVNLGIWILLNGNGTQVLFIKKFLRKLLKRKG